MSHRVPWLASVLLRIFILGFIAFGFQGIVKVSPLFAAAEQLMDDGDDPVGSAHGFDTLRIEQEDKLFVPLHKSAEVLNFLKQFLLNSEKLNST